MDFSSKWQNEEGVSMAMKNWILLVSLVVLIFSYKGLASEIGSTDLSQEQVSNKLVSDANDALARSKKTKESLKDEPSRQVASEKEQVDVELNNFVDEMTN